MTHARTRAPATAGQVADWFDAGFSHAGGFQASPKCRDTKEIAPLGHSPSVVDSLVDDLLLRRQPAGEVRGRQGILRGLLPEEETPGKVLCGIPEGRCQTSHAGPAGIGDGNSRPLPSGLPRAPGRLATLFPSAATARGRTVRAPRNWNDDWAAAAKRALRPRFGILRLSTSRWAFPFAGDWAKAASPASAAI